MENQEQNSFINVVNDAIAALGVDPGLCQTETEGQWNLKTNGAEVWVDLWYVEQEERTYFQVMSPMFSVPEENKETFYRELLDLNYQLIGACFVTYQNGVYVKQIREADDLTVNQVAIALQRTAYYSERFKNILSGRYEVKEIKHEE